MHKDTVYFTVCTHTHMHTHTREPEPKNQPSSIIRRID